MTGAGSLRERIYPEQKVVIREVGLRDGLQLVKTFPDTDAKKAWLANDYAAGIRHFEVGSYLPVQHFPQFADIDEIVGAVGALPGAFSNVLILNKKGALRALDGDADELTCVVSASEEHNLRNARRSRADGLREIAEIVALRNDSERRPIITAGIAMGFGCSIAGQEAVPEAEVLAMAEACVNAGVDVIAVADTVGYGNPRQLQSLVRALRDVVGDLPIGLHLHDTRGLGLANAAAALEEGVRFLDASLGGLGGCPFAPNATGNIVLEDVVFLAREMGFDVPVDVERLVAGRSIVSAAMPDEPLHGRLALAGLPRRMTDQAL